jgi:AcrR family transcriptional regulator
MAASIDRGKATRSRILAATAELIAQAGWSGFSTRDIAARAGVTQGVVSYHWRSKDELVREAALAATAESLEPVAAALREGPSVHAALERFLGLIHAVRRQPELIALLFETMLHAGRDEPLRAALKGMLRDFRRPLAAALARDGLTQPEARAAALAAALDGLLLHAVVDDELDVEAAGAALGALVQQA